MNDTKEGFVRKAVMICLKAFSCVTQSPKIYYFRVKNGVLSLHFYIKGFVNYFTALHTFHSYFHDQFLSLLIRPCA
jgi:hypothetical protein